MVKRRRPLTEARLRTIERTMYRDSGAIQDTTPLSQKEIRHRQKARWSVLDWVEEQLDRINARAYSRRGGHRG